MNWNKKSFKDEILRAILRVKWGEMGAEKGRWGLERLDS